MPAEPQKKDWLTEVDPDGTHGKRRVRAALNMTGVEPEDLDAEFTETGPGVHEKTPQDKHQPILQQRREIREGLRQSRITRVREELQCLGDDDARRFARAGGGIRPLRASDVPPVDALDGMEEMREQQQLQQERIQKAAERKGNAICTDFLLSKKRAEEADANVAALNARMKEFEKEQGALRKAKRAELQKKADNRMSGAAKAAEERAAHEDEVQATCEAKLMRARAARAQHYSTENFGARFAANKEKKDKAFQKAIEIQEEALERGAIKQEEIERRLARSRIERHEMYEERRQESQKVFIEKQLYVLKQQNDRQEEREAEHDTFVQKFAEARVRGRDEVKTKSKSMSDLTKKRQDKAHMEYKKREQERLGTHDDILARLQAGTTRALDVQQPLKFKCGNDVYSHMEVRAKTFGDLQQRRWQELQKAHDAKSQALCIKIAERQAKQAAQAQADEEVARARVEASKNTLKYSNEATEVFTRIQSESNEDKIRAAMEGLGFKMPGRATEEEGEAAEAK